MSCLCLDQVRRCSKVTPRYFSVEDAVITVLKKIFAGISWPTTLSLNCSGLVDKEKIIEAVQLSLMVTPPSFAYCSTLVMASCILVCGLPMVSAAVHFTRSSACRARVDVRTE